MNLLLPIIVWSLILVLVVYFVIHMWIQRKKNKEVIEKLYQERKAIIHNIQLQQVEFSSRINDLSNKREDFERMLSEQDQRFSKKCDDIIKNIKDEPHVPTSEKQKEIVKKVDVYVTNIFNTIFMAKETGNIGGLAVSSRGKITCYRIKYSDPALTTRINENPSDIQTSCIKFKSQFDQNYTVSEDWIQFEKG